MNKQLTFLLSFTFLFLFSGSVNGDEPIKTYWKNGNLMNETYYKDEKLEGVETWWWKNGKKSSETHWKNDKKEGLDKVWYKNGRKKYINITKMMLYTECLQSGVPQVKRNLLVTTKTE